jgi:hypothetical protein
MSGSSLRSRVSWAVLASLGAGLASGAYVLTKFHGYEEGVSRLLTGDQRAVLLGHLVEARVKAAEELASSSMGSEEANEAFNEKLTALEEDLKTLTRDRSDRALEEGKKLLAGLHSEKQTSTEDLFVQYRNMKSTAFNIYRLAWNNKWMTVAKTLGLAINDLDNLSYAAGEKAASGVNAKIGQLSAYIAGAPMAQSEKLMLLGQLTALKAQADRYLESITLGEKLSEKRVADLKKTGTLLKRFNDAQSKNMLSFGEIARAELFRALLAFLGFVLFSFFWSWISIRRFSTHVRGVAAHVTKQVTGWITQGGNVAVQGFRTPERPDAELSEVYHALDQAMRKMNAIRKEDILVKRLLNVPFLLVHRGRQAIFWNSALSILAKVRALEETGPVPYSNLMVFTTAQGKPLDPIERAFAENHEVSQLALLRAGDDGIAVHAVCTPVAGPDREAEYVMVHIRDLRDENRKAEADLDRQLESVRKAVGSIRAGFIPDPAPQGARRPVVECMKVLSELAVEQQEKSGALAGQIETMKNRMSREADLKRLVFGRMSALRDEVQGVYRQLSELRGNADTLATRLKNVETRNADLVNGYAEVRRRATAIANGMSDNRMTLDGCLGRLAAAEEISSRVRANEQMIRAILEKSTLLNANNSILGSKRELTPTDVVSITENVTQLMGQFERSYRFVEQSVGEIEQGLRELVSDLRGNLTNCLKIVEDDKAITKCVDASSKTVVSGAAEVENFSRELAALKSSSGRLEMQIQTVAGKIKRLAEIGQASLELQVQLELGFQGLLSQVGPIDGSTAPQRSVSEL